jgi:hypothetical protein
MKIKKEKRNLCKVIGMHRLEIMLTKIPPAK